MRISGTTTSEDLQSPSLPPRHMGELSPITHHLVSLLTNRCRLLAAPSSDRLSADSLARPLAGGGSSGYAPFSLFSGTSADPHGIFQINMIFAGVVSCLCATLPETFAPALLLKRAKRLRAETGDPNITTEQELFRKSLKEIVIETGIRPFRALLCSSARRAHGANLHLRDDCDGANPHAHVRVRIDDLRAPGKYTSRYCVARHADACGPSMRSSSPSRSCSPRGTASTTASPGLCSAQCSSVLPLRSSSRPGSRRTTSGVRRLRADMRTRRTDS